jgi:hypothetical protein
MATASARRKAEAFASLTYRCYHFLTSSSRAIAIQHEPAVFRLTQCRSFSSPKKENDLDTISNIAKPKEIAEPSSNVTSTASQKIWGYTKQFSSRVYVNIKGSASGVIAWAGAKVSAVAERSKDRITENIQSSVESTKSNISSRAQIFQERIKSSMRSSLDSLFQSVLGPLRSLVNYIANLWQTTPIWNRFFWWSLSAIAVYGIATTVPKEIVKHAIFSTPAVEKPARGGNITKKNEDITNELAVED